MAKPLDAAGAISPGTSLSANVDKYLLPHEQEVITVRKHPEGLSRMGLVFLPLVTGRELGGRLFRGHLTPAHPDLGLAHP
jgi:hypothetical protein